MSDKYLSRRRPRIDLTGKRFGRLIVLAIAGRTKWGTWAWLCRCDCGNEVTAAGAHLRRGAVVSCKCSWGKTDWEPIPLSDGSLGIPLTQGFFATIDAVDLPLVESLTWCVHITPTNRYAESRQNNRLVTMHRLVMGAKKGDEVDHRDENGLNNRRNNLRFCTSSQNKCNRTKPAAAGTSRFRGVSWDTQTGRWRAQIMMGKKHRRIGRFKSEDEAAKAYDTAARKIHGVFARLNFPTAAEQSALRSA